MYSDHSVLSDASSVSSGTRSPVMILEPTYIDEHRFHSTRQMAYRVKDTWIMPRKYEDCAIFFLTEYKTSKCPSPDTCPNRQTCACYHSKFDRRRVPGAYGRAPCSNTKVNGIWQSPDRCPKGDECTYAHTHLEQMYHPTVYKTDVCTHHREGSQRCTFGYYCTHAHGRHELRAPGQGVFGEISDSPTVAPTPPPKSTMPMPMPPMVSGPKKISSMAGVYGSRRSMPLTNVLTPQQLWYSYQKNSTRSHKYKMTPAYVISDEFGEYVSYGSPPTYADTMTPLPITPPLKAVAPPVATELYAFY